MARQRKYTKKKYGMHANKNYGGGPRRDMLNMAKIDSFDYALKNLLVKLQKPEHRGAIFASIRSKAANSGIEEAMKYVFNKKEEGEIDEEMSRELLELLDRFTKKR